jgi:hypothetical protein
MGSGSREMRRETLEALGGVKTIVNKLGSSLYAVRHCGMILAGALRRSYVGGAHRRRLPSGALEGQPERDHLVIVAHQ